MKKKTIIDLYNMKKNGEKVSWITAYDTPFASFTEAAGIDMILVGDSLGMVVQGFDSTIPVTMDCVSTIVRRFAAVHRIRLLSVICLLGPIKLLTKMLPAMPSVS